MTKRINFDFAADVYDATRGFPEGVETQVAASLLATLPTNPKVLEVGVGTGRIARPLYFAGARLTGVDISARMLARLRENLPSGSVQPSLVFADAATLPFTAATFDAVLFVHVLHLLPSWRESLLEAFRCRAPGGAVYRGYDWREKDAPSSRLRQRFHDFVSQIYPEIDNLGPGSSDDAENLLLSLGARVEKKTAATWTTRFVIRQDIQNLNDGLYSQSWRLPVEIRSHAIERLKSWAEQEFGSLDAEFSIQHKFVWERYSWD